MLSEHHVLSHSTPSLHQTVYILDYVTPKNKSISSVDCAHTELLPNGLLLPLLDYITMMPLLDCERGHLGSVFVPPKHYPSGTSINEDPTACAPARAD